MKLRIVHIITQLELGGAQQNTLYTADHLNRELYEPVLVYGPGGMLDDDAAKSEYPRHVIRHLVRPVHPLYDLLALLDLYQLMRRLKPHIVHTHSSKAGILGRLAAYLAGVPVIIHTFHGFGFTPGQSRIVRFFFMAVERACAWISTHLVFVSEDNRQEAIALGIRGAAQGSLIRSGIVMDAQAPTDAKEGHRSIRHELNIPKEAWLVVSVGNFKPQKNPMDLARVAAEVLKRKPETRFVFVGDGEGRAAVESWCQEHGIFANTHFLGWRRDIRQILAGADSFLLTSLWEGLPRALVEAFAAGLPAVAYAVNGVSDILKEGETGFPISAGEVATAADKIVWLQDHPDQAKRLGLNAKEQVTEEFNIDLMVRQQEALYKDLYTRVPLKPYYEPLWG